MFVSVNLYNHLSLVSYATHARTHTHICVDGCENDSLYVMITRSFTVTVLVTMSFISSHVNLRFKFIFGSLSPLQPPLLLPQHKFTQYFNYYVKTASKRDVQSSVFKILI